jgi:hypothetical protein
MAISGSNEYSAFADCRGKSNIRRFVTDHPGSTQIDVEFFSGLKDQIRQGFSAHAFIIWCMWADVEVLDLNMLKIKKLEKIRVPSRSRKMAGVDIVGIFSVFMGKSLDK